MNTAQLIVLWYAGLLTIAILAFQALSESSVNYLIATIAVLAALFIYTFRPHPTARKRMVFLAVAGPIIGLALGWYGLVKYHEHNQRVAAHLIPPDQIELANLALTGDDRLVGRVRNGSSHTLTGLTVEILLFEGDEKIGSASTYVSVEVPPGEARDFDDYVFNLPRSPKGAKWRYEITGTRGRASP